MYEGLDIASNKVTPAERAEVPHHMLNICKPTDRFSVLDYRNRTLPIVSFFILWLNFLLHSKILENFDFLNIYGLFLYWKRFSCEAKSFRNYTDLLKKKFGPKFYRWKFFSMTESTPTKNQIPPAMELIVEVALKAFINCFVFFCSFVGNKAVFPKMSRE